MNYRVAKVIVLEARKWFDKVNGNTYHSVCVDVVFDDFSRETYTVGQTYGYSNVYRETAIEVLKKNGVFGSENINLSRECQDRGIVFIEICNNVLKRDLHISN